MSSPVAPSRAYHVKSTLGKGGFGTVYRAELRGEGGFTKAVALKVLNPDMEGLDEIAQRMRDEARVLGLVRHRAIVQVDGLVRLNGRWTIVMELVNGVDLKVLAEKLTVPPGPALEMAGEIAGALHAAWTSLGPSGVPLRILHRDIKPSNAQLTALGEVKVLDFGIARADFEGREAVTRSLTFGSLEYMAPERMDLIDTPAGDIYALGSVLYELVAGQMLGKTSINPKRHDERLEERLLALQARLGGGSEPVLELLRRMLAYEHEARPDAREVERQCARLRRSWPEPMLRDWAEDVVPGLIAQRREQPASDLTGSTLYERTDSRSVVVSAGSKDDSVDSTVPSDGVPASGETWADSSEERQRHGGTRWEPIDPALLGQGERVAPRPLVQGKTTTAPRRAGALGAEAAAEAIPEEPGSRSFESGVPVVDQPRKRRWPIALMVGMALAGVVMVGLAIGFVVVGQRWAGTPEPTVGGHALDGPSPSLDEERDDIAVQDEELRASGATDIGVSPEVQPSLATPVNSTPTARVTTAEPKEAARVASSAPAVELPTAVSLEPESTPPEAKPTGRARYSGDATKVMLLTGTKRYSLPADVPAGTYDVEAIFPGRGQVRAGSVRVVEGTELVLRCQDVFGRCSVM